MAAARYRGLLFLLLGLLASPAGAAPPAPSLAAPGDPIKSAREALHQRRFGDALRTFDSILAAEPANTAALVGKAQALAQSGRGPEARAIYDRILADEPGSTAALVGLAWLNLWSDPATAVSQIQQLRRDHPDEPGVTALERAAWRTLGPRLALGYAQSDDSEGTSRDGFQLDGSMTVRGARQLSFRASQSDPAGARLGQDAALVSLGAGLRTGVRPGQHLELRVGMDRRRSTEGASDHEPSASASWTVGAGRRWTGELSATHEAIAYGPRQIDQSLTANRYEARLDGQLFPNVRLTGRFGLWDVDSRSGALRRLEGNASLSRRFALASRFPLDVGYSLSLMDHDRSLDNGFWAPGDYVRHSAFARLNAWTASGFGVQANVDVGRQSYVPRPDGPGARTDGDTSVRAFGMVSVPLGTTGLHAELTGQRSESGLDSVGGFVMKSYGVRLAWRGMRPVR